MDAVLKVVKHLLQGKGVKEEEIIVLSPYVPQIEEVKYRTKQDNIHLGACLTIDGAQGNEYPFVIISLVRCNGTGQIGFLDDFRRLNVGITRARKGSILIGSQHTLLHRDSNNVWTKFFRFCAENHLLKDCNKSSYDFAASTHKKGRPDAPKQHAKPTAFSDTIPDKVKSEICATIEVLAQDILECDLFHFLFLA